MVWVTFDPIQKTKNLPWPPNSKPRLHTRSMKKGPLRSCFSGIIGRGWKNYPVMARCLIWDPYDVIKIPSIMIGFFRGSLEKK